MMINLCCLSRHYSINLLLLCQVVKGGFSKMMRDQLTDLLLGNLSADVVDDVLSMYTNGYHENKHEALKMIKADYYNALTTRDNHGFLHIHPMVMGEYRI